MRCAWILSFLIFTDVLYGAAPEWKNWAGKYPMNDDPSFKNLFEVPEIRKSLKELLSGADWKLLTRTYAVMSPIEIDQEHLYAMVCKPHCCPCEHAMLVIDLKRTRFHVGFYEHREKKTTTRWISSAGDFEDIPRSVREEFYHRHVAK
jgi:hypothetical protein